MKRAMEALILVLLGVYTAEAQPYVISTIAGGVPPPTPVAGVQVSIGYAQGVAADSAGNLYFVGLNCVFKLDANGVMTRVAGNGFHGYSGDGGPATSARLWNAYGVAVDASGNLYIADYANDRVRKVSPAGIITTVAGDGSSGYSGDGGPATSAQLSGPLGVAVDSGGNLYVADSSNHRTRKVSPAGIITTVVGTGSYSYSGDGGPAAGAALASPAGVSFDTIGNLYIADSGNRRIRKVSTAGVITTVAGNGSPGYFGDGGPTTSAQLNNPAGVAVDNSGNLYVADSGNYRVRKVSAEGIITTVAGGGIDPSQLGDGGPAVGAWIWNPAGVAVDAAGNLYIASFFDDRIRKVSADGIIITVAGSGDQGDNAPLWGPSGVAVDASNNVYIADTGNNLVRLLTPSGSGCTYSVSSVSLQFPAAGGSSTLSITSGAGCAWTISSLPGWVTVSGSPTGSGSANVIVMAAPNSGAPRSAQISVAGITVTVKQASSVLLINPGGMVDAASYASLVAPGSIAAVFGNFLLDAPLLVSAFPMPTSLNGLSLEFAGAPLAPLFYASLGQVNAQVPWELEGQSQTTITATLDGETSVPQTVNLAPFAPGIFSINGAGTEQGAILNEDYTLVRYPNPATAGSTVVQIFCTGLGPVTHQPAAGAPASGNPLSETTTQPTVLIGDAPALVQFSGLAPGFVGLYQVNALVPQGIRTGLNVPVVISIGGVQSNAVTISVR